MNRSRILSAVATVGLTGILTTHATAQLADYIWNPANTGSQPWQDAAKWTAPTFPGGYPYTIPSPAFPNDPGRVDSDSNATTGEPTDLIEWPSVGANLSGPLGANLNVDVGATNVTVASLTMGGTSIPVATTVSSSSPGKLVFENYEVNRAGTTNPQVCAFNCGAAKIISGGVAGSINTISAPIQLNGDRLEFGSASTNNLTLSGPITFFNYQTSTNGQTDSQIRNLMPSNLKVTISGNISLVDTVLNEKVSLVINSDGQVPPSPPTTTNIQNSPSTGVLEISGVISDSGAAGTAPLANQALTIGTTSQNVPLSTVILSGSNTYTMRTLLNRANLVLANDNALGIDGAIGNLGSGANIRQGNPNNQFGFNILSDNDARKISVDMSLAQFQTVTGDHSLEWAGMVTQSNGRAWVNLLPAGKKLLFSGTTYGYGPGDNSTTARIFSYDGTGTTEVTGGWHDKLTVAGDVSGIGHYRKQGTGTMLVSDPGGVSDFTGDVIIDQGVMRFSNATIFDQARTVTSTGGAIGIDTGTFTDSTLLGKLNSKDHGGLMLTEAEADANIAIDFTSVDLANALNMSVAAPQGGRSYNGTITPATDAVTSVPTYRLGGGSGKLTLPGAKLTGARDLQVTNGGEVELNGANTYTGVTTVLAKYHTTQTAQAIANTTTNISNIVYEGTTLTANNLASGSSSSIGGASDTASNLVIQGSTLKYKSTGVGSSGTTNRMFTVGTGGATLESASTSAADVMNFTNTGTLVMDVAEDRTGTYFDSGNVNNGTGGQFGQRNILQFAKTDDLVIGMAVSGLTLTGSGAPTTLPAGAVIQQVNSAIDNPAATFPSHIVFNPGVASTFANYSGTGTVTIGGVARTLALTGTNTGNNTLSPLIANAAAATGINTVNIAKSGTGKWILTGNNTYTGTTTVNAGTLLINGTQSGNGAATVAAGATLGGTGTYGGAVTNNGIIAPGASVGTLNVTGNVTMGDSSHFAVELSGTSADKLAITGDLDLSGAGVTPFFNYLDVTGVGSGASWLIATYTGALTGVFESITPGYSVTYGGGQITLNTAGVPGDFNNDTKVNVADYVTWRKDPTNTNFGGANGYFTWRENFGTAASGPALGGGAVPEPSGLVMIGMALAIGIGGVRRRG